VNAWRRTPDGPLYLDWQRRGVGRICLSSGTTQLRLYRRIAAMLDALYDRGQLGVLRAIRDRDVTPLVAYDAYRRNRLELLPITEALTPLRPSLEAWIARAGSTGRRTANYRTQTARILRHAGADPILHEVPALLKVDRVASQASGQVVSHNRARAALLAFLRDTLGKTHAVYSLALGVPALPEPERAARTRLSVDQARAVRDQLPGPIGAAWWALCMTGMIASEYWARPWHGQRDRVSIHGTKRAGRRRDIPIITVIERPTCTRRDLSTALTALQLESYDARRAYAHWLEEAGIPRARRKLYLGHGRRDVTDDYEMGELGRYLQEDGRALRAYVSRHSSQPQHLVRGA
jgi:hypothetical protein